MNQILGIAAALTQAAWLFAAPLMLVALGGMFSARAGVFNLAVEASMVAGMFCAILLGDTLADPGMLLVAFAAAALGGALLAMLQAAAVVWLRGHAAISGTALNLLAPALIFCAMGGASIAVELPLPNTALISVIALVILVLSMLALKLTRFGLRLRACGESPEAAEASGIHVSSVRAIAIAISGGLAGAGGLAVTLCILKQFDATAAGYGFIALAVLAAGKSAPPRMLAAAILLALASVWPTAHPSLDALRDQPHRDELYRMLPYLAALVALACAGKRARRARVNRGER